MSDPHRIQIVNRQISGLGNQLFQYAAGRYFGTHHLAPVIMAIDPPQKAFSYGHPRPFLLSEFSIVTPWRVLSLRDRIAFARRPGMAQLGAALNRLQHAQVFREDPTHPCTFIPKLPLQPGTRTLYLFGYWQSYRMVDSIAELLRPELQLKRPAEGKNREVLARIAATRNPVSLHMRRGDYTLSAEGNRALPMEFYHRAIAHFRDRLDNPSFFVFSDDIPYARANLPGDGRFLFVDHNDDATSYQDLRLMAACHHHIIANSSFSWWGAWLNPRPQKMVYAPRYWMLSEDSYFPGLFPPHWTLDPYFRPRKQ